MIFIHLSGVNCSPTQFFLRGYVMNHFMNIYTKNELTESTTANEFLAVQTEGKRLCRTSLRVQVKGDDESRILIGQEW